MEKFRVPQDATHISPRILTKEERYVVSLLACVADEQIRRWANDLPLLTQKQQDEFLLRKHQGRNAVKA